MKITGKTVLVTGAARGLGKEMARLLDKAGCRLILADREAMDVRPYQNARALLCDLSQLEERKRLIEAAQGTQVLVNCAGIGSHSLLSQLSVGEIERVMQVNALAPLELTAGLAPLELVVNIGSVAGEINLPSMSLYAASKTALHAFSRAIRLEGQKTLLVILGPLRGTDFVRSIAHPRSGQPGWYRRLDLPVEKAARLILAGIKNGRREIVAPGWYRIVFGLWKWLSPLAGLYQPRDEHGR